MENHQRLIWRSPALSRCFPRIMNFYYSEEKAIGYTNMIPSSLGPTQENDSFHQVLLMQPFFKKMCFPLSTQILVTLGATKWFFISFFRFFHLHANTFTYILCNCMASIAKIESFLQCSQLYGLSIVHFPTLLSIV